MPSNTLEDCLNYKYHNWCCGSKKNFYNDLILINLLHFLFNSAQMTNRKLVWMPLFFLPSRTITTPTDPALSTEGSACNSSLQRQVQCGVQECFAFQGVLLLV